MSNTYLHWSESIQTVDVAETILHPIEIYPFYFIGKKVYANLNGDLVLCTQYGFKAMHDALLY